MEIEIFYNSDFPIIMTAQADNSYPLVHAMLKVSFDPPRFIIHFWELTTDEHRHKLEDVRGELIRCMTKDFEKHNLYYEIDGKLYKGGIGRLSKHGATLVPIEE